MLALLKICRMLGGMDGGKKDKSGEEVAPGFTSLDTTSPFLAFEEKLNILHLSFGLSWMAVDEALP